MSRNQLNQKQPSPLGSDACNIAENPQLDSESASGSCGKLQRCVENQLDRTSLDYHNMQISDYRHVGKVFYVEKVFENLRQTLRPSSYTLDAKINILLEIIYVDNDEIIDSSWTSRSKEFGGIQEYQLRLAQNVVRYKVEIDRGTITRDSEFINDDTHFLAMDEMYSVSRSSDEMGESKSVCLLRLDLVSGKDAQSFRCE